jgi:hypothetical protein
MSNLNPTFVPPLGGPETTPVDTKLDITGIETKQSLSGASIVYMFADWSVPLVIDTFKQ